MAYIPTEWETGDVITAAKLNNIEDGIVANEEAIDAIEEVADKKTFIYNLSLDQQTGDFSIEIDEGSPVPTVEDFDHPERNRVKLVLPSAVIPFGMGYVAVILEFSLILSIAVDGSQPTFRYSQIGALSGTFADFAVSFYPYDGEVTANVNVTMGD